MESVFPGLQRKASEPSTFDQFMKKEDLMPIPEAKCPICNSEKDDWEEDDLSICKSCGEVIERPLDAGAEFRFFGAEDRSSSDPCRVGAPMDMRFPSSTLGTVILSHAHGGNASNRMAMARVRRYHTWNLLPYKERALLQVFEQLAIAASNHGLDGRTIDFAKDLYIRLVEHCDRRGMSRTAVVASCIYSSLKMVGQPRKPKEIAEIFHLSSAQFTKSFKYFQEVLAMATQRGLINAHSAPAGLSSTRASDYIAHPLSRLPVSRTTILKVQEAAVRVAREAEEKELCSENMPPSLAAGVIAYVLPRMGHPDILQERIANVCGVSEGTLQKCLKKLEAADALFQPILKECMALL
uniref:Transcription factor TFIIB cyclin-like domain-containing protein n=1 Tax=viral metagenome TaxID=1070528 RepID=A0A6C0BIL2_9ZZZZ